MDSLLAEFIERYKAKRAELLESEYHERRWSAVRAFKKRVDPIEVGTIAKERSFQSELLEEIDGLPRLRNVVTTVGGWDELALLLKNKAERVSAQIDFLNYLHTFYMFFLMILLLLVDRVGPANWGLFAITCAFTVKAFVDRSNLRIELAVFKEVANLIEFWCKKASRNAL